jgi:hypothetical protein
VSSMRLPSVGDWKVTPSSLMSARCSSDTICAARTKQHKHNKEEGVRRQAHFTQLPAAVKTGQDAA